ncbi:GH25 family lysozyme [Mesorhizobium sp. WSM4887]|uniref:glycoside hydrolase family 25 protein n=1 Tax=Mesorhizobium sp. WSM4887 TaxID=3038543 RepID=UPI002416E827|nr:GH25 family lysozyme [Mesorhizobium sp. WSM4887]MDG4889734.1 GH25 family lysozyme [Mesorhizobium sp. WSM4887]
MTFGAAMKGRFVLIRLVLLVFLGMAASTTASFASVKCTNFPGLYVKISDYCSLFRRYADPYDGQVDPRIKAVLPDTGSALFRNIAIVISIDSYNKVDPEIGEKVDLSSARADLTNLLAFFDEQQFQEQIILDAAHATKAAINDILNEYVPQRASLYPKHTRVLLVIQAHGLQETGNHGAGFALADWSRNDDYASDVFQFEDLKQILKRWAERHNIFHSLTVLSVCFSGAIRETNPGDSSTDQRQPGIHVLSAASADGKSYSMDNPAEGTHIINLLLFGVRHGEDSDPRAIVTETNGSGQIQYHGSPVIRIDPLKTFIGNNIEKLDEQARADGKPEQYSGPYLFAVAAIQGEYVPGAFFFLGKQDEKIETSSPTSFDNPVVVGQPNIKRFFSPQAYPVHGVDVSSNNGQIDWPAAKRSGVDFMYQRVTGYSAPDPTLDRNMARAKTAGIARGGYFLVSFCESDKERQERLNWTIRKLQTAGAELPLAISVDWAADKTKLGAMISDPRELACARQFDAEDVKAKVETIVHQYAAETGKRAVIYGNSDVFGRLVSQARLGDLYDIWYSDLDVRNAEILHLSGNRPWTFWQHFNRGRINGFPSPVDQNVFFGSQEQFRSFLGGSKDVVMEAVFSKVNKTELPPDKVPTACVGPACN